MENRRARGPALGLESMKRNAAAAQATIPSTIPPTRISRRRDAPEGRGGGPGASASEILLSDEDKLHPPILPNVVHI